MPIQENQVSDQGLAALAGSHVGYLNLPVATYDAGAYNNGLAKGMFNLADLKEKYAEQQTQLAGIGMQTQSAQQVAQYNAAKQMALEQYRNQNMAQQGDLNRQNQLQIAQGSQAIQAQGVQNQGNYQQGMLGFRAGELNNQQQNLGISQQRADTEAQSAQNTQQLNQQKFQLDSMKATMVDKARQDTSNLKERQAWGSALYQLMQDPSYQGADQATKQQMLAKAESNVPNGVYTDKEKQDFINADPQTQMLFLHHDIGTTAAAMKIQQDPNASQQLTPAARTVLQQQIAGYDKILSSSDQVSKEFSPKMQTYQGQGQGILGGLLSKAEGMIPGSQTNTQLKQQAADIASYRAAVNGQILNTANTMKNGRSPVVQNALKGMMISPEDGPGEATAKQQAFTKWVLDNRNSTLASLGQQPLPTSYTNSVGQKTLLTPSKIDQFAKDNNISQSDAVKYLMQHP